MILIKFIFKSKDIINMINNNKIFLKLNLNLALPVRIYPLEEEEYQGETLGVPLEL